MRRIVGRKSDGNAIADDDFDVKFSHATGQLGIDRLPVLKLDGVMSAGQHIRDHAFCLNEVIS